MRPDGRSSLRELEWDAEKARVTNDKAANDKIHRTYRTGWQIMGA